MRQRDIGGKSPIVTQPTSILRVAGYTVGILPRSFISRTALHGLLPAPFLLSYSVFDFDFFIIFRFWAVR